MLFVKIPKNNLTKRPMRTILTCLGVALGIASLISLVGLSRGVENAWITGLDEKGTHILGMRKGSAEILTATLDYSLGAEIARIDGIRDVSGELIDLIQVDNGTTVLLTGWSEGSSLWNALRLSKGAIPSGLPPNNVIFGESIATALDKQIGDSISINTKAFNIKAIHKSKGTLNNNTVIMRLSDMQKLTGKNGQVTVFNIKLNRTDDAKSVLAVLSALKSRFERLAFQETSEIAENNKILQLFRAIAWGTSSIALVICVFVVLNTLLMSVTERKREIGIFSALGWGSSRIMMMIGLEALIITSAGGMAGIMIGIGGLHWLVSATELRAYIEPQLNIWILFETFFASVFLGSIASIYPAWCAIRIEPIEALRYE